MYFHSFVYTIRALTRIYYNVSENVPQGQIFISTHTSLSCVLMIFVENVWLGILVHALTRLERKTTTPTILDPLSVRPFARPVRYENLQTTTFVFPPTKQRARSKKRECEEKFF